MHYPRGLFNSYAEHQSYLSCLRGLSRGDKVFGTYGGREIEGYFIAVQLFNPRDPADPNRRYYGDTEDYVHSRILIGTNKKKPEFCFYLPPQRERQIISEFIRGKMYPIVERKKVFWINNDEFRISRIVKYDVEAEMTARKQKSAERREAKKAKQTPAVA